MILPLLRHDLTVLLRDRSLPTVLLIVVLSAVYAVWSGSSWKAEQIAGYDAAREETRRAADREAQQLAEIESGTLSIAQAPAAGLPNTVKTRFLQPPGYLEEFSIGNADLRPRKAEIAAMGRADDMFRNYQIDNPALLALGRFDLAFVTVYLLPLLILGLSYGVLSADRESGSLVLLLAQPLTAARLAWVRTGFRSTLVVVTLILSSAGAWLLLSPGPISIESLARLLVWSVITMIYGAFWGALVALVVARNRSSESNALALLLAWVVFTLLLPALVNLCAQTFSPVPSRLEYITTARAAENAANARAGELLQGYLLDHPELEATEKSAVAPYIKTFVLVQRRVEEAVVPVSARFDGQLQRQQAIAASLSALSPASLTQFMLAEVAGTSIAGQQRFEAQARALRAAWLKALEPAIIAGRRITGAELAALPRPEFAAPPLGKVLATVALPCGLLLLYTAVVVGLAGRRLKAFRVAED